MATGNGNQSKISESNVTLESVRSGFPSVSDISTSMDPLSQLDMEDDKDVSSQLQEYETQFFGFTPKSFINGVYNAVVEYIQDALNVLQEFITSEYGHVMSESQVREATEKILPQLVKKVDRAFDSLESYLTSNVFDVPSNVVLSEDKVQLEHHYTVEDEEALDKHMLQIKQKILAVKYANAKLQQELLDIEKVQSQFTTVLHGLQAAERTAVNAGVLMPKDAMAHTVDKIQKMMMLVQELESPRVSHNNIKLGLAADLSEPDIKQPRLS